MRPVPAVAARLRSCLVVFLIALPAVAGGAPLHGAGPGVRAAGGQQPATTTVFLVRHAERAAPGDPEFDADNPSDPPLSAAGRARADELARVLEQAGVTAVYASQFARTRQTVAPLAQHVGVAITVHDARDSAGLVELIVTANAGGVVVIAGHSNTVPELVEALGAPPVEPIEDGWEYDNLYVVTTSDAGPASVRTLKYGARSAPGG